MSFSISFLLNVILSLISLFGLFQTILKISFPQKFVWFISFFIICCNGVCNSLYSYGGWYIILFPALYPLKVCLFYLF